MKKVLLALAIIATLGAKSQGYSKEGIVEVPDAKSSHLYNQAKEWVFDSFKSAKSVTQVDIADQKLMAKGISSYTHYQKMSGMQIPVNFEISISIELSFKEGKYKYKIESDKLLVTEVAEKASINMIDSVMKATPGAFLLGKKFRERLIENQVESIKLNNIFIESTITNLETTLRAKLNTKDSW